MQGAMVKDKNSKAKRGPAPSYSDELLAPGDEYEDDEVVIFGDEDDDDDDDDGLAAPEYEGDDEPSPPRKNAKNHHRSASSSNSDMYQMMQSMMAQFEQSNKALAQSNKALEQSNRALRKKVSSQEASNVGKNSAGKRNKQMENVSKKEQAEIVAFSDEARRLYCIHTLFPANDEQFFTVLATASKTVYGSPSRWQLEDDKPNKILVNLRTNWKKKLKSALYHIKSHAQTRVLKDKTVVGYTDAEFFKRKLHYNATYDEFSGRTTKSGEYRSPILIETMKVLYRVQTGGKKKVAAMVYRWKSSYPIPVIAFTICLIQNGWLDNGRDLESAYYGKEYKLHVDYLSGLPKERQNEILSDLFIKSSPAAHTDGASTPTSNSREPAMLSPVSDDATSEHDPGISKETFAAYASAPVSGSTGIVVASSSTLLGRTDELVESEEALPRKRKAANDELQHTVAQLMPSSDASLLTSVKVTAVPTLATRAKNLRVDSNLLMGVAADRNDADDHLLDYDDLEETEEEEEELEQSDYDEPARRMKASKNSTSSKRLVRVKKENGHGTARVTPKAAKRKVGNTGKWRKSGSKRK